MIRFKSDSWFGSLLVYYGGVLPYLVMPSILYGSYCCLLYMGCWYFGIVVSADGSHLIAGCATFMLVFRLNQCYMRMQTGKDMMADIFSNLRTLIMTGCSYMKGSQAIVSPLAPESCSSVEETHKAAVLFKVHVVRLTLAFAMSLKFHARLEDAISSGEDIDRETVLLALLDLVRIKMLLTLEESQLIETICGCYEGASDHSNLPGRSLGNNYGNSDRYDSFGEDGQAGLNRLTRMLNNIVESVKSKYTDSNGDDQRYIVDFNRYHTEGASTTQQRLRILGTHHHQHDAGGVALPPIILQLVRDALAKPLCQSWGYPERLLNFHEMIFDRLMRRYEGISQLISMPLPLPYLQHSKGLLLIFAVSYPLCMSLQNGLWGNVVVPTFLVVGLLGFEVVADMLENPVGDDACDLNYYEMIHGLEVEAKQLFDLSEADKNEIEKSWQDLGHAFGLTSKEHLDDGSKKLAARPKYSFDNFFEWVRLPTHTLKYVMAQQSKMETVQESYFLQNCSSCYNTWRELLGKSVGMKSPRHSGYDYTSVPPRSSVEFPKRGRDRKQFRHTIVQNKALAEDVFLLTHFVALKSFNVHCEVARQQMDMLDFLAASDDTQSIRERLNDIDSPRSSDEEEVDGNNADLDHRLVDSSEQIRPPQNSLRPPQDSSACGAFADERSLPDDPARKLIAYRPPQPRPPTLSVSVSAGSLKERMSHSERSLVTYNSMQVQKERMSHSERNFVTYQPPQACVSVSVGSANSTRVQKERTGDSERNAVAYQPLQPSASVSVGATDSTQVQEERVRQSLEVDRDENKMKVDRDQKQRLSHTSSIPLLSPADE